MSSDVIANKYRIVREIARSNDVVYEATDVTMGRRLAVKELVIPPNLTGQARVERVNRFKREAKAAGRLSHPNIVTVYEHGTDGDRYFIAMEYLEGGTLRDALQARGALPLHEARDIAMQVLAGLMHAHAHRVVHRDVKPDNIHILPDGQIKLTDFGIARLTEEASLTGEGQVFGTPSYMSPEQIEGRGIDHRTDLFSLGVVLYEMLAGRKPFTGDSVVSITYNIMHADPPPLSAVPYGVEQVIFRALAKDPNRRFASADEMRQALRNADTGDVPAMFLPPGTRTGMGAARPGALPPAYGPGSIGGFTPAPPPAAPPANPPTMGSSGTVFAPPPGSGQPVGGPFVNWGPPGASPPAYAPPTAAPFPRRPARPLLSESARFFLVVMLWAVLLGALALGFILLFVRAYERQRETGASQSIARLLAEGRILYNQRQYEAAAAKLEQALKAADTEAARQEVRRDLVNTCNKLGILAFERRDDRSAANWWYRALELDPNNEDVLYSLDKLYSRMGGQDLQDWQRSRDGRVGGANPAAPGSTAGLEARAARAQEYLEAGTTAYRQGDVETARTLWQQAVAEAPGTSAAIQAQELLNQTISRPNF